MPGSKKAVAECFESIVAILPHALQHMQDKVADIQAVHRVVQATPRPEQTSNAPAARKLPPRHVCPHQTNTGAASDRNSPFPMVAVDNGLRTVLKSLTKLPLTPASDSHLDLPPFRASIKDGYALKAAGGPGRKRVVGHIAAGDEVS